MVSIDQLEKLFDVLENDMGLEIKKMRQNSTSSLGLAVYLQITILVWNVGSNRVRKKNDGESV